MWSDGLSKVKRERMEKKLYCKNCGSKVNDSCKFCVVCGTPLKKAGYGFAEIELEEYEKHKNIDLKKIIIAVTAIILTIILVIFMGTKLLTTESDEYTERPQIEEKQEESLSIENNDEESNVSEDYNTEEWKETEDSQVSEYILEGSDSGYLVKSDLFGMTKEECRLARNEIYARHGRIFEDEKLREYFEACEWYYPSIQPDDFKESMLNKYEVANRDLIIEYEEEQGYR